MAQPKKIEVLAYRVGKAPMMETLDNDLKSLQAFVGGYIEAYTIAPGITVICNEEGRLKGLPPNREVPGAGLIVGDFLVCRNSSAGNTLSLTGKQVKTVHTLIGG
jgi:hypothetical protein